VSQPATVAGTLGGGRGGRIVGRACRSGAACRRAIFHAVHRLRLPTRAKRQRVRGRSRARGRECGGLAGWEPWSRTSSARAAAEGFLSGGGPVREARGRGCRCRVVRAGAHHDNQKAPALNHRDSAAHSRMSVRETTVMIGSAQSDFGSDVACSSTTPTTTRPQKSPTVGPPQPTTSA